jgi:serine/threonine protein phosphatase PrpC
MVRSYNGSSWDVMGASVQGPYHKKTGTPNEDAIGWYQKKPGRLPIILSVADGLGDPNCFRSGQGARFAVDAAIEICSRHIGKISRWRRGHLRYRLLGEITGCWNRKIHEDLVSHPFTPEEEQISSRQAQFVFAQNPDDAGPGPDQVRFISTFPYSTTLTTVIITPMIMIIFQVGDGNIVIVRNDGSIREIFPLDLDCGRVIPLSFPSAKESCKFFRQTKRQANPAIVYLSSDGYSAGYDPTKEPFREIVAYEFHSNLQNYTSAYIQEALPSVLEVLSEGSGDDLTLGIIMSSRERIGNITLKLKSGIDRSEAFGGTDATGSVEVSPATDTGTDTGAGNESRQQPGNKFADGRAE